MCKTLGVRNLFTTTYHPQTNGQAERFNRALLASLRAFVAEHPRTWPEFVGAVAYAFNTQVHASTMVPPFDLVVTNPPEPLIIKREESMSAASTPIEARKRFLQHVQTLVCEARESLAASQDRYKADFRQFDSDRLTNLALVTRYSYRLQDLKRTRSTDKRLRHKLQWKAIGPYEVIAEDDNTVTIDRDGLVEKVSRDRVVIAASRSNQRPLRSQFDQVPGPRHHRDEADGQHPPDPENLAFKEGLEVQAPASSQSGLLKDAEAERRRAWNAQVGKIPQRIVQTS